MQKDEITKLMICVNCGHSVPSNMKSVQDTQLEAGNQADTSTPYLKTVSFPRKREISKTDDIFNNPADAWNSDA